MSEVTRPKAKLGFEGANAILLDIGRSLRRVSGGLGIGKPGRHSAWHQGKLRTELLSWETDSHTIERQEFSFFGRVVEYRAGQSVRTGMLPPEESDRPATAKSELFVPHRQVDSGTLQAAATILRGCTQRDLYTQHLLGEINKTINVISTMRATTVLDLGVFADLEKAAASAPERQSRKRLEWIASAIVAGCLFIAFLAFLVLWQR